MIAPACPHNQVKRFGRDRKGNQRYRCLLCGKTWLEPRVKPLGEMRLDHGKAVKCLEMLLEGVSIRSTERLANVNRNTILRLLETVGARAQYFWTTAMRGLPAANVQADEVWGFVRHEGEDTPTAAPERGLRGRLLLSRHGVRQQIDPRLARRQAGA